MSKEKNVLGSFLSGINLSSKPATTGARTQVIESTLVAQTTKARFRLNSGATRPMGLKNGDYITLVTNRAEVERYLANPPQEFIDAANASGYDVNDPQFIDMAKEQLEKWGIAKGYPLYKADGTPKTVKDRVSKQEVPAFMGAKSVGKGDGINMPLDFSDAVNHQEFKSSLGDDASKYKVIYDVDTKNPYTEVVNDGAKDIELTVYPISYKTTVLSSREDEDDTATTEQDGDSITDEAAE